MSETLPKATPDGFIVGDSAKWTLRTVVYGEHRDPAASWALAYDLRSAAGSIDFAGSDNGDGAHLISLAAATTADYPPGVYSYQATITKGADRYVVETGSICIEPNFATLTEHDGRSWAAKTLEAIEAVLEQKASADQLSYSIQGRSLTRMTWSELMAARDKLRAEVAREARAERIAKGLGHTGKILVRF